jgi:transposase
VKSARNQLDILSAYHELGSYRAAAALCGTTHRTVRHVVERQGQPPVERPTRPKTTDPLGVLIAERVRTTDGRISAKRLLPTCRAAGYTGSARHLRRAVATAKADWRRDRRVYRPWQPVPGEHLAIDWGSEGPLHVFCAVLPWSRWRFVRFALDETQATTLALLAECFELLGGVPAVVLADRMGCLKGGVVANVVVPAPGYLAFASHYGFRPDFCEAADPESKAYATDCTSFVRSGMDWLRTSAAPSC